MGMAIGGLDNEIVDRAEILKDRCVNDNVIEALQNNLLIRVTSRSSSEILDCRIGIETPPSGWTRQGSGENCYTPSNGMSNSPIGSPEDALRNFNLNDSGQKCMTEGTIKSGHMSNEPGPPCLFQNRNTLRTELLQGNPFMSMPSGEKPTLIGRANSDHVVRVTKNSDGKTRSVISGASLARKEKARINDLM